MEKECQAARGRDGSGEETDGNVINIKNCLLQRHFRELTCAGMYDIFTTTDVLRQT